MRFARFVALAAFILSSSAATPVSALTMSPAFATLSEADLAERRDDFLAAYFERCPWSIASRLPVYQSLILFKQASF